MRGIRGAFASFLILTGVAALAFHSATAKAQDGALDPTFGNGGIVELAWPAGAAEANAVAIDSTGRIIVGGHATGPAGDEDFALFRLSGSGVLDPSYASDAGGFRVVDFNLAGIGGSSDDTINDIAALGDDSVVAIGEAHFGIVSSQFALTKTDANGQLDPAFGDNGRAHFGFDTFFDKDQGQLLRIDDSGRILVAGNVIFNVIGSTSVDTWIGIARLTAQGQLDGGFYGNGRYYSSLWGDKSTTPPTLAAVNLPGALVLDSSQRVVVAGMMTEPFPQAIALMRGSADGGFDQAFGTQGTGRVLLPLVNGSLGGVVALPAGKLMVSGTYGDSLPDTPFLMRLNEDGSTDASFASSGLASAAALGNNQFAAFNLLAPTRNGGWLLAGQYGVINGSFDQVIGVLMVRFDANGNPVNSFGTNGIVRIVPDQSRAFAAHRAVLQADGKLVVGGSLPNSALGDFTPHFAVIRVLADYDTLFVNGFEAVP